MSSRKYNSRAITLDSIGTISDIIKNLIKIDTEERIEKSKEDIRSYYKQRQDLNKRIARTQRRRTELLSQVYQQHKEEIDKSFNEEAEDGPVDQISSIEPECSTSDQDLGFESGHETESDETINLKNDVASSIKPNNNRSVEKLNVDISKKDLLGFDHCNNSSPSDQCVTINSENYSFSQPVSEKVAAETMLLYRVPQQVIKAKTELSLKLRKRSKGRKDSIVSLRDSSREKPTKANNEADKNKSAKLSACTTESNDKKKKHVSKKDQEAGAAKSKLGKQLQQNKDKSPNKDDVRKSEKEIAASNEIRKTEPESVPSGKKADEKKREKASSSGEPRRSQQMSEKIVNVKNELTDVYLMQKSRGFKQDRNANIDDNELWNAKAKLSKIESLKQPEEKQYRLRDVEKIKRKTTTTNVEQSNLREPTDYEKTANRILKAKEKIRKEFSEFEQECDRKQINKPMMNLIKVPNADSAPEKRSVIPTSKNRQGQMIVESISTSEEVYENIKERKTSKTENSVFQTAGILEVKSRNEKSKSETIGDPDKMKKKSAERKHSQRIKQQTTSEENDEKTSAKKLSSSTSTDSSKNNKERKTSIKYSQQQQHQYYGSDPCYRVGDTGWSAKCRTVDGVDTIATSEQRRSRRASRKAYQQQQSCAPKIACPGGDVGPNGSAAGSVFVRRKSPVYIKPPDDIFERKLSKLVRSSNADANPFPVKLRYTGTLHDPEHRRSRTVGPSVFRRSGDRKHSFSEIEAEESHGGRHARIDEKELSEAEKVMQEKKAKQEEDEAERLRAYEEQRRIEREKEEEELRQLKEKQERRRQEREEEERLLAERRQQEEERRRQEEEERKRKQDAEKSKKEAEKLKRQQMQLSTGPLNIPKKEKGQESSFDKFGNIVRAKAEMGLTKEQHDEQKRRFLSEICRQVDFDGVDTGTIKSKIKEMYQRICRLEGDKYDLEQRHQRQEYDLKELNERQRQIARNKALKKGLDPNEAASSRHPPKVAVVSKYDRQIDRRSFRERRQLYEVTNAIPHFPNIPPPVSELEKVIKPYAKKEEDEEMVEEEEEE